MWVRVMSEVSEEKWWGGRRKAGGRKEGAADAALKTKTPHVNVGNDSYQESNFQARNCMKLLSCVKSCLSQVNFLGVFGYVHVGRCNF